MNYSLPTTLVKDKNQQFSKLRGRLISLAGLIGHDIVNQEGQFLGKVVDLVFRWDTHEPYPPLTGVIAKVARRHVWITAHKIDKLTANKINLATAKLNMKEFVPREGEVRLAKEVLDHQLIDVDGARVVRASDLYVALVSGQIRLVGVDVSFKSLLRRLGPRKLRIKPTPEAVIDWATIQSFGGQETFKHDLKLAAHRQELRRLRPGELADLLEDLGRDERQELLDSLTSDQAADALEEMQAEELEVLLRESSPSEAATYLANMEPDEAADALRDVDEDLRQQLLSHMPKAAADKVEKVLSYDEETAGGFMNTAITMASGSETVEELRLRLRGAKSVPEFEAIALVDDTGKLIHDLTMAELFLADPNQRLSNIISGPAPVTVPPNASIKDVAELLINNRRPSVLVVDNDEHPLGRILADDIVDALVPERGRFHFPRVFS